MSCLQWLPVAVLVAGWAFAGMRHAPVEQPVAGVLGVAIAASVLVAFWVGRRSGRAAAWAAASARAEARAAAAARAASASTSTAAVVVNVGDQTRRAVDLGVAGLDRAPWMGEARALVEQDHVTQLIEDGSSSDEVESMGLLESPDLAPVYGEGSAESG